MSEAAELVRHWKHWSDKGVRMQFTPEEAEMIVSEIDRLQALCNLWVPGTRIESGNYTVNTKEQS